MARFVVFALLFAALAAAALAQDTCACDAQSEGWTINCANTAAITSALTTLASNSCASSCSSEICRVNYHIVQAHHDYCDEDDLPEIVEEDFHDFEDACDTQFGCSILRRFNSDLPSCPTPDCDDDEGNEAYDYLVANNCASSCTGECATQFYILRAYHDLCPDGAIDQDAEEGIHDFEEACENCNVVDDDDSQTTCDGSSFTSPNSPSSSSNNDDDHDNSSSSSATTVSISLALTVFAVASVLC